MSRISKPLTLSVGAEGQLQQMLQKGVHSVRSLKRAQVLLSLHQGQKPEQVSQQVGVSRATVYNIAQRYESSGSLESALTEKPRPGQPSKFDKALQAQLTALACSPAPQGRSRWTLRLLADKMVELRWLDAISYQAVGEQLKKMCCNPG
jgi:putative transposase